MGIIGSNWYKSGVLTAAAGVNTVIHGLGYTPDVMWVQYGSSVGSPTLPARLYDNSEDPTYFAFVQSNGANVVVHAYAGRLHSMIS